MRWALFLGCTIPARLRQYELSARKVAEKLGIEFVDLEGFDCCGFPIKSVKEEACLLMAARNIALAEREGLNICTLCSACTGVLAEAKTKLEDAHLRQRINTYLKDFGLEYRGTAVIKHFVRVLYEDIGIEAIKQRVTIPLAGIRIASHYGCHYLKPSEVHGEFDDPEAPRTMDEIVRAIGAEDVNYLEKKFCCGGGLLAIDPDIAYRMVERKLDDVTSEKADALVLFCPFCDIMYEASQKTIEDRTGKQYNLPVLFLPQLLGLALGIDPKDLGLQMNRPQPVAILAKACPCSLPVQAGRASP
jgi:heterodisulfide reductase subunit B